MNENENTNQEVNTAAPVEETTTPVIEENDGTQEMPVEDTNPEDVTLNEDGSVTVAETAEEVAPEATEEAPVTE